MYVYIYIYILFISYNIYIYICTLLYTCICYYVIIIPWKHWWYSVITWVINYSVQVLQTGSFWLVIWSEGMTIFIDDCICCYEWGSWVFETDTMIPNTKKKGWWSSMTQDHGNKNRVQRFIIPGSNQRQETCDAHFACHEVDLVPQLNGSSFWNDVRIWSFHVAMEHDHIPGTTWQCSRWVICRRLVGWDDYVGYIPPCHVVPRHSSSV